MGPAIVDSHREPSLNINIIYALFHIHVLAMLVVRQELNITAMMSHVSLCTPAFISPFVIKVASSLHCCRPTWTAFYLSQHVTYAIMLTHYNILTHNNMILTPSYTYNMILTHSYT